MSEAPLPARRNVGPYRVEHVLGRGGMGIVYQGIGPDGSRVAIKLARDPSAEGLMRFEREARIRIEHPHVVRLLDTGRDDDGSPYIVFELLRGESLKTRMRRGGIGLVEAVTIGRQLCRGLAAAHELGVIHRDLKPGNVHACEDGSYKILDFGLALRDGAETQLVTADRAGMGTPAYLSPEQVRGDRDIDTRTDLWSLGCVLYEILTGHKPFERDVALGTMLAIVLDEPDGVRSRRPDVPPALAEIVERCLEKRRQRRWSSAQDLERALADLRITPDETSRFDDLSALLRPNLEDVASSRDGTRTEIASAPSIAAGEQRVVAILLAEGVTEGARLAYAVSSRGGTVISLVGRRVIGLFGAERWEGDEVERAAMAALDARGAVEAVAIASGRAARSGQGIAGAVVRSAEAGCLARLRGVAADAESARWLSDRFVLRAAHEGHVEILGEARDETATRPRTVSDTPTLGRDLELARIARALEIVADERRARALLISGPLGIGKSALLREAVTALERSAGFLLTGRAEPHLRDRSHSLLGALLFGRARAGAGASGWSRLDGDVALADRQQAVLDLASEAIDDGARAVACAELLGELLGVRMPASTGLDAARTDPRLMNDRIEVALQDYLGGLASQGTLVIVIEDLQWADAASLDVIEAVLAAQRDAPVLVVATARPELFDVRPSPLASAEVERIDLRGLGARDVASLAREAAGRSLPEPLLRAIAERTGGNPLFVGAIARELAPRTDVEGGSDLLPLPLTVEAAVQSRLDHLPPAEKDLCKRASIFGRAFTTEELLALGVTRGDELLASLAQRDLVVSRARVRGARGREYAFRSTLVQEVAYRMLADGVRDDLHRRAAAHLATLPGAAHEERAEHHERGGEPSHASVCWSEAALEASRRGDGAGVLRCVERAFALGPPEGSEFSLRMAKADALRFLGRRAEQTVELDAAILAAPDDASLARALAERTTYLWRTGNLEGAIDEGARAVAAARLSSDREVTLLALGRHGAALLYAGRHDDAEVVLREAEALASARGPMARATVADLVAQLAAARGDPGAAELGFRAALAGFTEAGDLRRAANAEANLADAENRIGRYALAAEALRAATDKCRRVGNRLGEGYALANLGYSLFRLERHDEALDALRAALAIADDAEDGRLRASARAYFVRAVVTQRPTPGDVAEAEEAAAECAAGHPTFAVLCLAAAARGHLALRDPHAALRCSSRAIALRDELGSIEEDEAEVFLVHADALAANGRSGPARAVLERGRARLLDVAARIRDASRRAGFLDHIPAHRRLAN